MLLTLREIGDIILMCLALGFIFGDSFKREHKIKKDSDDNYDPIETYKAKYQSRFINFESMKFAMLVTAPAIIFHELGHKFVALFFGYTATFHAAYFWLVIGIIMKLMSFPFVFFVPAYVSYSALEASFKTAAIAFAGPFVNFLIFLGMILYLKFGKPKKEIIPILVLTKNINLFLFFFNMIPLGFFDGYHVLMGLKAGFGF